MKIKLPHLRSNFLLLILLTQFPWNFVTANWLIPNRSLFILVTCSSPSFVYSLLCNISFSPLQLHFPLFDSDFEIFVLEFVHPISAYKCNTFALSLFTYPYNLVRTLCDATFISMMISPVCVCSNFVSALFFIIRSSRFCTSPWFFNSFTFFNQTFISSRACPASSTILYLRIWKFACPLHCLQHCYQSLSAISIDVS